MVFTETTFEKCIANINNINAVLFFGPNFGLGTILGDKLEKTFSPEEKVIIDYDDVDKNFKQNLDSLLSNDFFSKKKLIKIYNVKGKILKDINCISGQRFNDKLILFFAPDVDGKSALKNFFEKNDLLVSINCYEDDEKKVINIIQDFCNENNLKIESSAITLIAQMLHGDRKALLSELEKLSLFYNGNKNNLITNEDITNIIKTEQTFNASILIDNILLCNKKRALQEYELFRSESGQIIVFLRFFIKNIMDFIDMKKLIDNGMSLDQAMKIKFIFFKRIPAIKSILSKVDIKTFEKYIKNSLDVEKIAKIYGNDTALRVFEKKCIIF